MKIKLQVKEEKANEIKDHLLAAGFEISEDWEKASFWGKLWSQRRSTHYGRTILFLRSSVYTD